MSPHDRPAVESLVVTAPRELVEARIARAVAALREDATARIAQMTKKDRDRDARDAARSDAVMSDDGGPAPIG